jgi:anthranilate 1,2-dioxygenase small subunit
LTDIKKRLEIGDLFYQYGSCLDDGLLEDWLNLFADKCSYKIMPRENIELGLPAALMLCENKNMLVDRIVSLRQANEFSVHRSTHIISNIHIKNFNDPNFLVVANYAMYHADSEGNGSLFSFGSYNDTISFVNGEPKFVDKIVIVENWSIPHMLSIPI